MITFYFGEPPYDKANGYCRAFAVLRSVNGSAIDIPRLGGTPHLVVAVFDESTIPWTCVFRSAVFSFKDARVMREDFPQFYFGEHGDIWDSDSFSKTPVFSAPNRTLLDYIAEA